ncbi:hypothetical protein L6R52_43605, partial [Myxococcota bacterium]|nr:hypothetical protein [Myxococcota bacterium]
MAISSRFLGADAVHRRIDGCPLSVQPPSEDERACATCPFNVVFPEQAQVGCSIDTPVELFSKAHASLARRDAALAVTFDALRATPGAVDAAIAERWLAVATRWDALIGDDEPEALEVASIIARFARAVITL